MGDYNHFRLTHMSSEAQEATDRAIVNYLEWALCTEVFIISPSNNTSQATNVYTQLPFSGSSVHSCVTSQDSLVTDSAGDIADASTPEKHPDHADHELPSSDGSMAQYWAPNGTVIPAYLEQAQSEVSESME
jgi:hypothetical protein